MDFLSDEEKFYKVLHLILRYESGLDNMYVEKIVEQLQKDENKKLLNIESTTNWLLQLIMECEQGQIVDESVFVLAIRLTTLLCNNEGNFIKIREKNVLEKFAILIRKCTELQSINIKSAHIQLLIQISKFSTGFEWLMRWQMWRFSTYYSDILYNQLLLRERATLLSSIILKLEELQQFETCQQIVDVMLEPLLNHIWYTANGNQIDTTLDNPKIKPIMLHFHNFMEHFYLCVLKERKKLVTSYYILIKKMFQNTAWKSRDVSFEVCYTQQLLRTQIVADYVRLVCMRIPDNDTVAKPLTVEKFSLNFFNTIYFCTERMCPEYVLVLAEYMTRLWSSLKDLQIDDCMSNSQLKFMDQVLMIQLFPILFVIKELTQTNCAEYVDQFCLKLFYMSCEYTTRHLYAIAEVLRLSGKSCIDLACKSIRALVEPQTQLTTERATLVFQGLLYVLIEYLPASSSASTVSMVIDKQANLLSVLLSALYLLISNYQITWKNCVEATSLINICLALLSNPDISGRLTIQVLKLLQLSIKSRIGTPNLALLVDSLDNSGLENLGPYIKQRLEDTNDEVRDSAVELTIEMVNISKAKFPAFQRLLVDHEIMQVIVKLATTDQEGFVRALAFKCIKAALSIQSLRNQILTSISIKNIMNLLIKEEDTMVRMEAIHAFTEWFAHIGITQETADLCFSTLAYLTTNDLDFEVRLSALEFWKVVLEQNFVMQGWTTDNGFPSIIFNQKKMIKVTPREIEIRLNAIVEGYAYYGGCGVLLTCCNDDTAKVAEKACEIIEMFLSRLRKYGYGKLVTPSHTNIEDLVKLECVTVTVSRKTSFSSTTSTLESEDENSGSLTIDPSESIHESNPDTIEDIFEDSDYNILAMTLEKMQLDDEINKSHEIDLQIDTKLYQKYATISESVFLDVVSKINLRSLVNGKTAWLTSNESLSSIFNDLITSFAKRDVNQVECY